MATYSDPSNLRKGELVLAHGLGAQSITVGKLVTLHVLAGSKGMSVNQHFSSCWKDVPTVKVGLLTSVNLI